MTLQQFQTFVALHLDRFAGVHPHSSAALDGMEQRLGHGLPDTLRWLLTSHGYSECCGVGNLGEVVDRTLECRRSIALPPDWLILDDKGDSGVVLLDLATGRVCWCGSHNVGRLATADMDADADWFEGYPEWVARCVAVVEE